MRLLLTTDAVGGVWRYSADLARGLRRRGIECVLAVLGPAATPAQRHEVEGVELVHTGLPLDWTAETPADLAAASERLAGLAALLGADAVHLHAPALATARFPAPVVAVAHSCVGTWWRAMRTGPPPPGLAWRIEATALGLRRAGAVIAPSAAHADAVHAAYGVPPPHVVHNGAAPVLAAAGPRARAVLTAGRLWDEAKGAAAIDRAAGTLDAPVLAAGPLRGPTGGAIGLRHLRHLGTLDPAAMARAYAEARVFVSMARFEPFGLSVLEAAGAGCRLVLADTPVFRELWDGAATFVGDDAALRPALQRALDTPDDGAAPARAARYTLDRMIDATLQLHRRHAMAPA